ncbi:MAG: PilZ domain-containing protein, partial [Syntrophales bacterium]
MNDARRYQRYAVNDVGNTTAQGEVIVGGKLVQLVDFSLSGLCVLSKIRFSPGGISISVEFGKHGKIDLIGKVVRMKEEGDMWRISIDLTETYK